MSQCKYDTEEIVELYKSGMSGQDVADEVGCSSKTVYKHLDKAGVERRTRSDYSGILTVDYSEEYPANDMAKMYKNGLTLRDVASEFNISPTIAKRCINSVGVTTEREMVEMPNVKERYESGESTADLAECYDCHPSTVVHRLNTLDADIQRGNKYAYYFIQTGGYEYWMDHHRGERSMIPVHRLAAVAWFGYDSVVGNDIHHKNHIPWDNREDNLEPMTHSEHSTYHNNVRWGNIE